jgi:hypothetical protein
MSKLTLKKLKAAKIMLDNTQDPMWYHKENLELAQKIKEAWDAVLEDEKAETIRKILADMAARMC